MPYSSRFLRLRPAAVCAAVLICTGAFARAQSASCATKPERPATAAETALAEGNLTEAERLFEQAAAQKPMDAEAIAGLARARLRLGKEAEAAKDVQTALLTLPPSASLQVALAELQLSEGQPWLARESLDRAAALDPCSAQTWLVRSKLDRLDSMHAAERADITKAHELDPADPEVKRAWNRTVVSADDIHNSTEYLRTTKNVDPELRKAAEESVATNLRQLSEDTATCKGFPEQPGATLPLLATLQDGQHIDGYQLKAGFGTTVVPLGLDTVASGFYVSRAVADANGLKHREEDPANTVHADAVQIGPLTFHDCLVGVSESPFSNKAAGFMGTDLFAQYLVELNFPQAKLSLRPLPSVDNVLPGDRPTNPELLGYTPVVHRLQYMMVPVTLNSKERRLFVLDSGLRLSAVTLSVAHLVDTARHGFTSSIKTVSGSTIQTYNDSFDLDFAHQELHGRTGLLAFDATAIEKNTGMRVGGLIGLDILQSAVLTLDYRDGLMQMVLPAVDPAAPRQASTLLAKTPGTDTGNKACTGQLPPEIPRAALIVASNSGMWDVHQMKLGQTLALHVERAWETSRCHLEKAALIHGRVVTLDKGHDPDPAHLGVLFDRAECFGQKEQPMPLRLVSVMESGGPGSNIDSSLPSAMVHGAGRQINDSVDTTHDAFEFDSGPDAKLKSIKTGSVQGLPSVMLDTAGPACSAVLTGAGSALRVGAGTRWLLVSPQ